MWSSEQTPPTRPSDPVPGLASTSTPRDKMCIPLQRQASAEDAVQLGCGKTAHGLGCSWARGWWGAVGEQALKGRYIPLEGCVKVRPFHGMWTQVELRAFCFRGNSNLRDAIKKNNSRRLLRRNRSSESPSEQRVSALWLKRQHVKKI